MNKVIKISLIIVAMATAVALLGFVHTKHRETTCWKLDITIENNKDNPFISEADIRTEILNLGTPVEGSLMNDIDIARIRKTIEQISSVKKCNVYKTLDGKVEVEITQRTPIARILNRDGSGYYLDRDGVIMELSDTYTAKVPLITGELMESGSLGSVKQVLKNERLRETSKLDEIFRLVTAINRNEFMRALTDYIYIDKKGDFNIVPRIGRQDIILGDTTNLENKFINLKSFYQGTINKINIDQYKAISVKYEGQVIGIK